MFFSFVFNGFIDNVTGTLIFSFVCNGWIYNVTVTLTFGFNNYNDNVTETWFS